MKITLSQFEANVGDTDIVAIGATTKVYDSSDPASATFFPIDVGDVTQSLEIDGGVYELGNVAMSVDGLASNYFNNYGSSSGADDERVKPFVLLIQDSDDSVIFHGVVNPESCRWNAKTQLTAFEALSWEFLLDQATVAPRTVFETTVTKFKWGDDGSSAKMEVTDIDTYGDDLNDTIQAGDVVVWTTNEGEHRAVVQSFTAASGVVEMALDVVGIRVKKFGGIQTTAVFTQIATDTGPFVRLEFDDALLHGILSHERTGTVDMFASADTSGDDLTARLAKERPNTPTDPNNFGSYFFWPAAGSGGIRVVVPVSSSFTPDPTSYTCEFSVAIELKEGDSVKILGRDIYGYSPAGTNDGYNVAALLLALYNLTDFGVLKHVVTAINIPAGYAEVLHKFVDLPGNPKEALRLIQNTQYTFLKHVMTEASGIPRLAIEILPRDTANTTDQATLAIADVVSWVEEAADLTPVAVVVTPNIEYFRPRDDRAIAGFYYDGIETDEATPAIRKLKGPPSGTRVMRFVVLNRPAYAGPAFSGDGTATINDTVLRVVAKRFWDFYDNLPRTASGKILQRRYDILGSYVSTSEVDGGRTAFVLQQTTKIAIKSGGVVTTFKGRVGEYTPAASSTPVAVITGPGTIYDNDNNDKAVIRLSGLSSYDPNGEVLTYEWKVTDDIGTAVIRSTTALLNYNATKAGGGDMAVTLKVTNVALTASTLASQTVRMMQFPSNFPVDGVPAGLIFRVEKHQIDGSPPKGQLFVYPLLSDTDTFVTTRYRKITGSDLPLLDRSSGSPSTWYPETMTGPSTDGEGNTYFLAEVDLDPKHNSTIEIYLTFNAGITSAEHTQAWTFDFNKKAQLWSFNWSIREDGTVFVDMVGDEDTESFRITSEVNDTTPDATGGTEVIGNGDSFSGSTGEILAVNSGDILYIRVELFHATSQAGGADYDKVLAIYSAEGEANQIAITSLTADVDSAGICRVYWAISKPATTDIRITTEIGDTTPDLEVVIQTAQTGIEVLPSTMAYGDIYYIKVEARNAGGTPVETQTIQATYRSLPDGVVNAGMLIESSKNFIITAGSFTSPSLTQLDWTGLTLETFDGVSYGPFTADTGDATEIGIGGPFLAATTYYIYLDTDGTPALKTTSSAATARLDAHIILGVAKKGSTDSTQCFWVPAVGVLGGGLFIDADHIAANTITAALIQALAIDTQHLNADAVTAVKIDVDGVITLNTGGGFTDAAGTTGWTIDKTSIKGEASGVTMIEILASTGVLEAGGGVVTLDDSGISILGGALLVNGVSWHDSGGEELGRISCAEAAGTDIFSITQFDNFSVIGDVGGFVIASNLNLLKLTHTTEIQLDANSIRLVGLTTGLFIDKGATGTTGASEGLLYVDSSGNLRYRGPSNGTDTQLAPA